MCLALQAPVQAPVLAFAAPSSSKSAGTRAVQVQSSANGTVKPWKKKDCRLVLEDGSVWWGVSFGKKGTEIGEVGVFQKASFSCREQQEVAKTASRPVV